MCLREMNTGKWGKERIRRETAGNGNALRRVTVTHGPYLSHLLFVTPVLVVVCHLGTF